MTRWPTLIALLLIAGCAQGAPQSSSPRSSSAGTPPSTRAAATPAARTSATTARTSATSAGTRAAGPLAGRTVVLDPGHNALNSGQTRRANAPVPAGGFTKPCNTSGTSTDDGYPEHAYAFDVSRRAADLLRAQGATVVLTRPDDRGFGPCVNERAAIANRAHAALTISIHADGATPSGFGFHVIEPGLAPDHGNAAILTRSAALALDLRAAFRVATGEPFANYVAREGLDRRSDLAGLNLARVPAAFIECGNMRNTADAQRLKDPVFRQRAARGVDQAIFTFLRR